MNGTFAGKDAASTAEVQVMVSAAATFQATGNAEADKASFSKLMSGNNAWAGFNKTYELSIANLKAFTERFEVKNVVDDRGLSAMRAVDRSSGQQNGGRRVCRGLFC